MRDLHFPVRGGRGLGFHANFGGREGEEKSACGGDSREQLVALIAVSNASTGYLEISVR